jgi:sulfite reductase (NADPH) hemoprotein beta-component
MPSVVTANDLRSGAVVYLAPDGRWIEDIAAAAVATDADALQRFEDLARAAVIETAVTAVYAFDVKLVGGRPEPISVRERIRAAHAPTV